jgi:cytochrome c5
MTKDSRRGIRHPVVLPLSILALASVAACAQPAADTATMGDTAASAGAAQATGSYTQDDLILAAAKVALPPTSVTAADLPDPGSQGAQYVVRFCSRCHAVPTPLMHSATDWPGVTRRMWLRMERIDPQYAIPVPEIADQLVILQYLTDNSLKVSEANLPDFPGRARFEQTCAQCHELADPRQHSPGDWYVVVRRMNEHMREILGQELTADEIQEISLYLQNASE